jgi:hypothetical protein
VRDLALFRKEIEGVIGKRERERERERDGPLLFTSISLRVETIKKVELWRISKWGKTIAPNLGVLKLGAICECEST